MFQGFKVKTCLPGALPVCSVIVEECVLVVSHLVEGGGLERHGPRVDGVATPDDALQGEQRVVEGARVAAQDQLHPAAGQQTLKCITRQLEPTVVGDACLDEQLSHDLSGRGLFPVTKLQIAAPPCPARTPRRRAGPWARGGWRRGSRRRAPTP